MYVCMYACLYVCVRVCTSVHLCLLVVCLLLHLQVDRALARRRSHDVQEQCSLRTRLYRERSLVSQAVMDFHLLCRPLASMTSSLSGNAGDGVILQAGVGGCSCLAAPDSRVVAGVFGNGDGARLEGVAGVSRTSSGTSARAMAANEY